MFFRVTDSALGADLDLDNDLAAAALEVDMPFPRGTFSFLERLLRWYSWNFSRCSYS